MLRLFLFLFTFLFLSCNYPGNINNEKPRLLITTDIGGDPDDQQSLVRLLVHSNEFDIEGLIASASGTPGELDTSIVKPHLIHEQIDAYEIVYPNLLMHDSTFPLPDELRSVVKSGNPYRGKENIGKGHTTEGSAWIVQQMLKEDEGPLYIGIWGGQTDVTQALWTLKDSMSPDQFNTITNNIIIYDIMDQDGLYTMIRDSFPGLFYVRNKAPEGMDRREAVFRGMYLGGNMDNTSREWIYENIKTNHGPLGMLYPDKTWTAPNPHGVMKEGDTPSWFYFLSNGLQNPQHPGWGGWGGRFINTEGKYYTDASDKIDTVNTPRASVWRWRNDFQNQFAARMDWCVKSYMEANHSPVAVIHGDHSREILNLEAAPGDTIVMSAAESTDPDNDKLSFQWWIYSEASSSEIMPVVKNSNAEKTEIALPENLTIGNIHLILEVTDNGNPSLTAYRRVIIEVID